jgi:transcriptional regulator with XRE-family HTH domain
MSKQPNTIDRHIGAKLRLRRVVLGLSQTKLGEAIGVTFQQVQKYEKGANRIGAGRLEQLARFLEVSPSYFYEGAPTPAGTSGFSESAARGFGEQSGADYVVDFVSTAEGLQLNKAFAKIRDPRVRKRIVDLVTSLAEE